MRTWIGVVGVVALFLVLLAASYGQQAAGIVLVSFSILVFVWASVGLLRPSWARLPNRLASVWVWALSVGLLVAGGMLQAPPSEVARSDAADRPAAADYGRPEGTPEWLEPRTPEEQAEVDEAAGRRAARQNPNVVSADTWTNGPWPLTVDGGLLTCVQESGGPAVFLATGDGAMWPLNGHASGHAASYGAEPDIMPIWRDNPDIPGTKVNIGPLIQHALSRC